MNELIGGDEALLSLWADQNILPRTNGFDCTQKDQQYVPVPIVLLEDRRFALHSENGQFCLVSGLLGEGEDMMFPLPTVLDDSVTEFPTLSDATIKSVLVHGDLDPELPLMETNELPDLTCKDLPDLSDKTSQDIVMPDLPEALVVYNCNHCSFSTPEPHNFIEHNDSTHVNTSKGKVIPSTHLCNPVQDIENPITGVSLLKKIVEPPTNVTEHVIYLCSECTHTFPSIEECRDHMIEDHKMVFDDVDIEEIQDKEDTLELMSSPPNPSTVVEPNPSPPPPTPLKPPSLPPPTPPILGVLKKKKERKPKEYDPEIEAKPHKCTEPYCGRKFRTVSSLEMHVECHLPDDSRKYCCPHCSMLFNKWGECTIHLWKEHNTDIDLFTCQVCSVYKTTTRKKLDSHSKIHSDERSFKCTYCDKAFKQQPQLLNHVSSVHKKGSAAGHKWYMNQKCEICLKTYSDSKSLKKHMKTVHSKLKPYKCQICGHLSALKAMLQAHMRQHTGEKPFACEMCPFKTGDHNSLRRHIMRHTGKRPYSCPHCKYSCIQSSALKTHINSRHPGKSGAFVCSQCFYSTVNEQSYKKHLSDHKLNLIPSEVEVFPENVAAAKLVYRSFGASPSHIHSSVTGSTTSRDGMKQTITISIPSGDVVTDDEDTSQYLIGNVLDTGGITIPAEPDPQPVICID